MRITDKQLEDIIEIIKYAGKLILDVYDTEFTVNYKDDDSPLTIADQRANSFLIEKLSSLFPSIHFITEETKDAPFEERAQWDYTWIIDPLDGTKEFVKRNGEFTVNIALCYKHEIIFGMIFVPVTGDLYYAKKGEGAYKLEGKKFIKLQTEQPNKQLIVVTSRSHRSKEVEDFVQTTLASQFDSVTYIAAGSSLKMCLVAEGKAHVYPRLGPTMEWDVAAGHIIAEEAGAFIFRLDNNEKMDFNKRELLNPHFIVTTLPLR